MKHARRCAVTALFGAAIALPLMVQAADLHEAVVAAHRLAVHARQPDQEVGRIAREVAEGVGEHRADHVGPDVEEARAGRAASTDAADSLTNLVNGWGYEVRVAYDAAMALATALIFHPDVMLLDLAMPGLDGFQVLEEKQRDPAIRDIPVFIITSRDPSGDPIISNTFTVTHSGGLSQSNLIACIHALGEILAPTSPQETQVA